MFVDYLLGQKVCFIFIALVEQGDFIFLKLLLIWSLLPKSINSNNIVIFRLTLAHLPSLQQKMGVLGTEH